MNIMSLLNSIVVIFNFLQLVTTRLTRELEELDKQQCYFLEGSETTVLIPSFLDFAYLVQSLNFSCARAHTNTHKDTPGEFLSL